MRAALATIACTLATLPLHAQPPAPRLELRTATGQTTFHLGERIPLTLSFTGPENTYGITLYNFGRTDPLRLDSFAIAPAAGWVDSLGSYSLFLSGMCCGAKQAGTLSSKPTELEVNLNEWARFDDPGTYTVTITSHRVYSDIHGGFGAPAIDTTSNPIQVHIIPATPKWQKATFDRILRALAAPQEPYGEITPQRRAAIDDLRYLDSPAALTALAANLRDDLPDLNRDAQLGLVGLPRSLRDTALSEMNKLIDDPSFPVSQQFLETIPWLQIEAGTVPVVQSVHDMQVALAAHLTGIRPFLDAAWEAIASQLPRKDESARAVTAQTLVAIPSTHPSPEASAQIGAILRASFPDLSTTDKARLLVEQWDAIRSRSLIPQLRAIAESPWMENDEHQFGIGSMRSLRASALQRWYEFEPDSAMIEILHQIGTATPKLSATDLDFLPSQTFPQFEALWAHGFADGADIDHYQPAASLLIRFGTGAAIAQMTPLITKQSSDYACNRPGEALAYLIKFDPKAATRFLNQPIANHAVSGPNCLVGQIDFLASFVQDPALTQAAMKALGSTDPRAVSDALRYLRKFGEENARQPILERYLQWSDEWSTKPIDPDNTAVAEYDEHNEVRDDRFLGEELARALLASQAWLPDPALIRTVQKHCAGKQMCNQVMRLSEPGLTVSVTPPSEQFDLHIGAFDPATMELFEAKIDQFPKGTVFTLEHTYTGSEAYQNRFEATMPAVFTKHGMKLITPSP